MSKLLQGAGVVEWTAWLDQIRLAARTSIRTKKVGAGSKKWFDSEIRELHVAQVSRCNGPASRPSTSSAEAGGSEETAQESCQDQEEGDNG
jgi:hypothetical protein